MGNGFYSLRELGSHQSLLEDMLLLREAVPDLARVEARKRTDSHVFSTSTDVNMRIDPEVAASLSPEELQQIFQEMLAPYVQYEADINSITQGSAKRGVSVALYRYGHMNPRGIDLHTRVIVKTKLENVEAHEKIVIQVQQMKKNLHQAFSILLNQDKRIQIVHGEKGKISSWQFVSVDVQAQCRYEIGAAGTTWNFRAPQNILSAESVAV